MKDKEIKSWQMKARFTPTEKEKIFQFCEEHSINLSDLIRVSIYKYMDEVTQKAKLD